MPACSVTYALHDCTDERYDNESFINIFWQLDQTVGIILKLWENALNSSISGCSRSSSSTAKQCFLASNALLEFVEKERASIIGDVVIAALGLEVKVTDAVIVIGHKFDCTRTNSYFKVLFEHLLANDFELYPKVSSKQA